MRMNRCGIVWSAYVSPLPKPFFSFRRLTKPQNPDQQEEPTLISLTPQLLPILAEVLAPEPKDQLKEETRGKVVQLVGFLAGKDRKEVGKYEVLREVLS